MAEIAGDRGGPLVRRTRVSTERAAFLSDVHHPYGDEAALELAFAFLDWYRPDIVFLVGDIIDAEAPSRYDKAPDRELGLQHELDVAHAWLARLRKTCPGAFIVYIGGNHDARVEKMVWRFPAISPLRCLSIPSLLRLEELKIEYHRYGTQLTWAGLLIEHGDRVSGASGATAKKMLETRGVSGLSGHVHRLAAHYRTDHNGVKVWYENGCLCRHDMDYITPPANWQTGFSVGRRRPGRDRFEVQQIPILDRKLFYEDRLWEV